MLLGDRNQIDRSDGSEKTEGDNDTFSYVIFRFIISRLFHSRTTDILPHAPMSQNQVALLLHCCIKLHLHLSLQAVEDSGLGMKHVPNRLNLGGLVEGMGKSVLVRVRVVMIQDSCGMIHLLA